MRCGGTVTEEVVTSAESRERRSQADGKDRSRLDAEAASWQPPRARAGCRDCGTDGKSSDRSPRSPRTSDRRPDLGLMQRTASVPLHPRSTRGLEPKQVQHLLHRDLSANSVEVDAWHGCFLVLADTMARCSERPFRSLSSPMGNGNGPPHSISRSARCQPAGVRQSRPARSSDSSASPRRSFLTASESRSFARVSTSPWARRSSTCSSRLRRFRPWRASSNRPGAPR